MDDSRRDSRRLVFGTLFVTPARPGRIDPLIGMVVIVAKEDAELAAEQLRATGETVFDLGTIEARAEAQAQTVVV